MEMSCQEGDQNPCLFTWSQGCAVWLTSVIVQHCYTDYNTKTAEEEYWPCGSGEKREFINYMVKLESQKLYIISDNIVLLFYPNF